MRFLSGQWHALHLAHALHSAPNDIIDVDSISVVMLWVQKYDGMLLAHFRDALILSWERLYVTHDN